MVKNDNRDRNNMLAMAALCLIVALIAGTVIVTQGRHRSAVSQACLASGQTNCAPISTNSR